MDISKENQERKNLNSKLKETDGFFKSFSILDDLAYEDHIIPKKYKELIGLSISITSGCNECILYHIQECLKQSVSKIEILELLKMSLIGGGSVLMPNIRYAFRLIETLSDEY